MFSIPGSSLESIFAAGVNLTGSIHFSARETLGVEAHNLTFAESLVMEGPAPLRVTVVLDAGVTAAALWISCSVPTRLDSPWNTVLSASVSGWSYGRTLKAHPDDLVVSGDPPVGTDDVLVVQADDSVATITFFHVPGEDGTSCNEGGGATDGLSSVDSAAFSELSDALHRDTWAGCHGTGSPCDACEEGSAWAVECGIPETKRRRRRLAEMSITALVFPNLGIQGELPLDILAKFPALRRIDFSSDPTKPNPNYFTLPAGMSCVGLDQCFQPGASCTFAPLPLCSGSIQETPVAPDAAGSQNDMGWVAGIPLGILAAAIVVAVVVRRRKRTVPGGGGSPSSKHRGAPSTEGSVVVIHSKVDDNGEVWESAGMSQFPLDADPEEAIDKHKRALEKSYREQRQTGEFSYGIAQHVMTSTDEEQGFMRARNKSSSSSGSSTGSSRRKRLINTGSLAAMGGQQKTVKFEEPDTTPFLKRVSSFWAGPPESGDDHEVDGASNLDKHDAGAVEQSDDAKGIVTYQNPEY